MAPQIENNFIPVLAQLLNITPQANHITKSMCGLHKAIKGCQKNRIQLTYRQNNVLTKGISFLLTFKSYQELIKKSIAYQAFIQLLQSEKRDLQLNGERRRIFLDAIEFIISAGRLRDKLHFETYGLKPHIEQPIEVPMTGKDMTRQQPTNRNTQLNTNLISTKPVTQYQINTKPVTHYQISHVINQSPIKYKLQNLQSDIQQLQSNIQHLELKMVEPSQQQTTQDKPTNTLTANLKNSQPKITSFFSKASKSTIAQLSQELEQKLKLDPVQTRFVSPHEKQWTQRFDKDEVKRTQDNPSEYQQKRIDLINYSPMTLRCLKIWLKQNIEHNELKHPQTLIDVLETFFNFVDNHTTKSPHHAIKALVDYLPIFVEISEDSIAARISQVANDWDPVETLDIIDELSNLTKTHWKRCGQLMADLEKREPEDRIWHQGEKQYSEDDDADWIDECDDLSQTSY